MSRREPGVHIFGRGGGCGLWRPGGPVLASLLLNPTRAQMPRGSGAVGLVRKFPKRYTRRGGWVKLSEMHKNSWGQESCDESVWS